MKFKSIIIPILLLLFFTDITIAHQQPDQSYIPDDNNPCLRNCEHSQPKKCHFTFVVEWYVTLSRACHNCPFNTKDCLRKHCVPAEGLLKDVMVVNRKIPGPSIQVCLNDMVIVTVKNTEEESDTSIHWHGQHQRNSPFMDGVPHVTQCPIPSGTSFRYKYQATQKGTHLWHSHSGTQRGEGFYGSLIVRTPKSKDVHGRLYDFDDPNHLIVVSEWYRETVKFLFVNAFHSNGDVPIHSLLVNGLGYFMNTTTPIGVPAPRFTVKKGYRYRFRFISSAILACPIVVSVNNHTLTIISTDGYDIQPRKVTSFVAYSGERFDFIINADQEISNYWIQFKGLIRCEMEKAHQVAVLNYEGADPEGYPQGLPTYEDSAREGLQLNPTTLDMIKETSILIPELNSVENDRRILTAKPTRKYIIHYDFYNVFNPKYFAKGFYEYDKNDPKYDMESPQLNHISLKLQSFPLLTQKNQIVPGMFCNENSLKYKNCTSEYCHCTHVIEVPLNSIVELILVDMGADGNQNHPFHLHGHSFWVTGMERLNSSITLDMIKKMDANGQLKRRRDNAPIKDTVTVPRHGYTILRFLAYNPGYWLFHCHIDFHASLGMALVFKVGEDYNMKNPPYNFPKCGDYVPDD